MKYTVYTADSLLSVVPVQTDASSYQNTIAESETDTDGNGVERGALCTCAQGSRFIVVLMVELHSGL